MTVTTRRIMKEDETGNNDDDDDKTSSCVPSKSMELCSLQKETRNNLAMIDSLRETKLL